MADLKRRCVSCGNNMRGCENGDIVCRCLLDGHYIGYVECFEDWCHHWKRDRMWDETKSDLKPCPFCGWETITYNIVLGAVPNQKAFYCQCDKCLSATMYAGTKKAAREKWNRRSGNG